jgi:urease accessory protein
VGSAGGLAPEAARHPGPATATHRHGRLGLTLERRGARTIVAGQEVVFPSGTVRITDVDGDGVGELQVTNPSGGLLAGDRMDTVLTAGAGTRASVVTQGANRVCGAAPGAAPETTTLHTALSLEGDAALEWAPHHLVPYARSVVLQRTTVDVAPDAGLLLWETLSAGRTGRGERFAWERLDTRLRVSRAGLPLLHDGAVLGGGGEPFDGADLVSTVVVVLPGEAVAPTGNAVVGAAGQAGVAPRAGQAGDGRPEDRTGDGGTGDGRAGGRGGGTRAEALANDLHHALTASPGTLASASALDDALVVARIVARDANALYTALHRVRLLARPAVGLPPARRPVV